MKKKKIASAVMAAAMLAASALNVGVFGEGAGAEDGLLNLITAEIPKEFRSSIIYVEGVGLLDISGEGFDSSENGSADANANLDIDFDGIGYVSEKNLEAWRETGVLTFSNLKADFDTTGLQWGMFVHSSEYVQLVKRDGAGEVIGRGLYRITDGEIEKLCDLDTFWTYTRADGVSVGLVENYGQYYYDSGWSDEPYINDLRTELQMTVTQPDGTKKTETLAVSELPAEDTVLNDESDVLYIGGCSWATPTGGDVLATVGVPFLNAEAFYSPAGNEEFYVYRYYADGTKETIYELSGNSSMKGYGYLRTRGNIVFWATVQAPYAGMRDVYFYHTETGNIESLNLVDNGIYDSTFYLDSTAGDKLIMEYHYYDDDLRESVNAFSVFSNAEDIKNVKEKARYADLGYYFFHDKVTDESSYFYYFEDLDGKKGFMDLNEKVITYVDDFTGFSGKYHFPVLKDGKAYLLGEDFNAASVELDADGIADINDGLFIISRDGKYYFVTDSDVAVDNPAGEAVMIDYDSEGLSGFKAEAEEGVIEDGAVLTVSAVADKTDENSFTYNICFKKGGTEVQPNGEVTVKIPIPDALKDKTIYVYRAEEDGSYTKMEAVIEDGYIVFTTDHFSEYLVTSEKISNNGSGSAADNDEAAPDGEAPGIDFGVIAIIVAAVVAAGLIVVVILVCRKRK